MKRSILLLGIVLVVWQMAKGQVTTEGNDFWLAFMENGQETRNNNGTTFTIYITAKKQTSGRIYYNGGFTSFNVSAGGSFSTNLSPDTYHVRGSNRDPNTSAFQNRWIRVTSTGTGGNNENFSLYALNQRSNSSDATVILPKATLGNEYYVMSYADPYETSENNQRKRSQVLIMAVEDSTRVVIRSPEDIDNGPNKNTNDTITFKKAGELVQLQARDRQKDLTGMTVRVIPYGSNSQCKNVAVFAGHGFCRVSFCTSTGFGGFITRDHLWEQMFPTSTWGKNYIFVPYMLRTQGDVFRVMAKENNTKVIIGTDTVVLSRAGDYRTYDNQTAVRRITADKPISVAQYSRTQNNTSGTGNTCGTAETRGDPFYIMLSPNEQLLRNIRFEAFTGQAAGFQYYVNVITKTADTSRVKLDGSKNNITGFQTVPNNTTFAYARRQINAGSHTLESDSGFIAYVYGFSNTGCGNSCFESFGYSTGASLNNLNARFTFVDTADASKTPINSPTDSYCLDKVYDITISADTVFKNFTWNFGDGSPEKTGKSVVKKYSSIGTYQMKVVMSTASGDCTVGSKETITKTIKIFKPSARIKGRRDVCEGETYTYYADSANLTNREANKFTWKAYGGTIVGSATADSVVVKWGNPNSNARLTLFPDNAVACAGDSTSIKVKINAYKQVDKPSGPALLCTRDMKNKSYSIPQKPGLTYKWGIVGGTILTTKDTSDIKVDWNGPGRHKIWVNGANVIDSICYRTSDTLFVEVQQAYDSLTITSSKTSFCYGESIRFNTTKNAGYISYHWDFGDGTSANTDTVFKSYTHAGTYTVKLTASTAADICEIKNLVRTMTVTVFRPTKPVISGRRHVCDNATGIKYKLTDTEKNTYTWSVTGGTITQNQTDSITVNWGSGASGVIKLKTKNAQGCEDSVTYNVIINDYQPTAKPSGPDSVCSNARTNVKYSVPATFGYAYNWKVSGGTIASGNGSNEIRVNWTAPNTTGFVWLEGSNVVDSLCFKTSDSLRVYIKKSYDTLSITAPTNACQGEPVSFGVINNAGYTRYDWDFDGNGTVDYTGGPTATYTYPTKGTYTIKLRARTPAEVCFTDVTVTKTITIQHPTRPVISGDVVVCAQDQNITYSLTDTESNTYQWSVVGGTISGASTGTSIKVNWGSANEFARVKVRTQNALGCIDSVIYAVRIKAYQPTVKPSGPDSVCTFDKNNKTYSVPATFGYAYNWKVSNGTIKSGQGTPQITVDWGSVGVGYVWLEASNVVDSLCFAASDSLKVVIRQEPSKDISITYTNDTLCANAPQSFGVNAHAEMLFFEWDVEGTRYTTRNITHTFTTTGLKTITLKTRTAPHVCYSEGYDTFKVFIVEPTAKIVGPNSVCPEGPAIKYWLSDKYFNTGYQWKATGGTISSGATSDTVYVAWGVTNLNAKLQMIPRDVDRGCTGDTVTLAVRINRKLQPTTAGAARDSICNDEKGIVFKVTDNNTSIYTWYSDQGTTVAPQGKSTMKFDFPSAQGYYKVWYRERSTLDTLCEGISDTFKIFVRKRPSLAFETKVSRDSACIGENLTFEKVSADADMKHFEWDFGDGSAKKYGASVNHAYSKEGRYKVRIKAYTAPHVCYTETFDSFFVYIVKPSTQIAGRTDVCRGATTTYRVSNTFLANSFEWFVSGGSISGSKTADSVVVVWADAVNPAARLRCVPKSKFGCYGDTASFTVRVNDYRPTEKPTGEDSLCIENRFNQLYTVTPKTGYSYQWRIQGGVIRSGQGTASVRVDWDTVTSFTTAKIWLERSNVIDSLCFEKSPELSVLLEPAPSKTITVSKAAPSFCVGATATFNLTYDPLLDSLEYNFGDGSPSQRAGKRTSIAHVYTKPGIYTVSVSGRTKKLCKTIASGTTQISIEEPRAKISGRSQVCQGAQNVEYTTVDTTTNRGQYRWRVTGGNIIGSSIGDKIVVNWSATQNQGMVYVTPYNAKGCIGPTDSLAVRLNPYQPTPTPAGPTDFCVDDRRGKVYTVAASPGRTYDWGITFGTITSGQGTPRVTVDWQGVGTGRIWLERSTLDSICFEKSPQLAVRINPGLDSLLELATVTNLPGDSTRLRVDWRIAGVTEPSLPLQIYRRTDNGSAQRLANLPKNQTSYTDNNLQTTKRTYQYWIQSFNRCQDTLKSLQHTSILLKATKNEKEKTVELQWNAYQNWNNGVQEYKILRKLDDTGGFEPYATTQDTRFTYEDGIDAFKHCFVVVAVENATAIEARSNETCTEFEHKIFVYDLITPNGDGKNDVLIFDRIERYANNTLIILNRFGQEVYRVDNYRNDWSGVARDGGQLEGTYFYILTYEDKEGIKRVEKGPITILR